jgi:hypothetical protein
VAGEVRRRALRRAGLGLAASLVAGSCAAVGNPVSTDDRITGLCQDLGAAIFGGRLDRALELTFPRLVALAGRDQVAASLRASAEGSAAFKTEAIACEPPTQHSTAGGLDFALVPTLARARTPDGLVYLPQHYLAISSDRGRAWTFLLLGPGVTIEKLRPLLPDGIGDMTLPVAQQPFAIPVRPSASAP